MRQQRRQPTTDPQPIAMPRPPAATGEVAGVESPRRDISTRGAIVLFFAVGLLLYLAWYLRSALLLIYMAIMVAVLLTPFVTWVERRRIGRWHPGKGLGVLLLALIFAGAITIFLLFAVPPIERDAVQMSRDLPRMISTAAHHLGNLPYVNRINPQTLTGWAERLVGGAFGLFRGLAAGITAFITMVILAAYFIVDGERAFEWSVSLFPLSQQPRLRNTLLAGAVRMRRWLAGQALLMLIHGASATIAFGLLGLRYFYLLGVFAGIVNIVPVLGPIATVIVAALVASTQGWDKVAGAVIFFVVYHNLENAFLSPRIMRAQTNLPAVAVLVALVIGGELAGIVGILAAVPTAALLATVMDEYLSHARSCDQEIWEAGDLG
jgi:predicted PurR-regulated permease PerM